MGRRRETPIHSSSSDTPENLRRRFFRLTWLNILSNLTVPLVGLVDTAMLGHLSRIHFLAGVALASILFEYVYWSFGFLRMGATGTTAQAVGRQDQAEVYLLLYRFLALALALGTLLLVLQPALREVGFALLGGTPEVEEAGRAYFSARIWGAPAVLCNFVLLGWFLGREEAQKALWMNLVANLANVGLNYLFIIRMGLAAQGAGLATMSSQYLMLLVGGILLLRAGPLHKCRWREVVDRARLSSLLRLNRDILVRTLGLITAFALFTNFSALLGTTYLAANSILLRLLAVASFAIDGVAFATESLAGIVRGRQDRAALFCLVRLSLSSSFMMGLLFIALLAVAGDRIWLLLTSHADVAALSHCYRYGLYATLIFGSLAYAYDGIFLGLTAGQHLRNGMLFGTGLAFLPIAVLSVYLESNVLLWVALTAFMVGRTAYLGLLGRRLIRE